jgi:RNA polymerase sigma-70 factor (sigma-E family)
VSEERAASPAGRVSVMAPPDARRDREIAELFEHHYARMCRLAFVILGDRSAAEEIVMEALLRTYAGWGRVRDRERVGLYLKRAVVNLCRSRMRRAAVEARVNALIQHRDEARGVSSEQEERRLTSMTIWDAVRALPERQRACVVLRYYGDLAEAEIAEVMDCSIGTVKSQLSKGRAKLEATLGELRTGGAR